MTKHRPCSLYKGAKKEELTYQKRNFLEEIETKEEDYVHLKQNCLEITVIHNTDKQTKTGKIRL